MALADGRSVIPLLASQDHKAVFDDDQGPNTGGMGAYCPVPFVSSKLIDTIMDLVIEPAVRGLGQEKRRFKGVLYAGLMITDYGPRVIEFNCRFGDPETQVVLPLMENDLAEILAQAAEQDLKIEQISFRDQYCVGVVMASGGYPQKHEVGLPIRGIEEAEKQDCLVFHAGTTTQDGQIVCGMADNLPDAIAHAYEGVEKISFENEHHRKDIASRAMRRKFKLSRQV